MEPAGRASLDGYCSRSHAALTVMCLRAYLSPAVDTIRAGTAPKSPL